MLDRLSLRARLLLGVVAPRGGRTGRRRRRDVLRRCARSCSSASTSTLEAAHAQVERTAFTQERPRHGQGGGPHTRLRGRCGPPAARRSTGTRSGRLRPRRLGRFLSAGGSPPKLPATIRLPAAPDAGRTASGRATSPSRRRTGRRPLPRARVDRAAQPNRVLIIATSLGDVDSTLHRLVLIELLVTLARARRDRRSRALGRAARSASACARSSDTAAAIAAGDLSQRVERAEPRPRSAGSGLALNAMLAQIESAFAQASEAACVGAKLRRFVADASHELRTPLAAVRAYAELFERGAATRPDDLARSMSGHHARVGADEPARRRPAAARAARRGPPARAEPVELAERRRRGGRRGARRRRPSGRSTSTVEPATVIGDRDRLRQVIDNLFANVARAHARGHARLRPAAARATARRELSVARLTAPG